LTFSTCAVSGDMLDFSPRAGAASANDDLVACPYGRLYKREKILEALLRRARGGGEDDHNTDDGHAQIASTSISHIRGMKDLHAVRFHVTTITCGDGVREEEWNTLHTCVPNNWIRHWKWKGAILCNCSEYHQDEEYEWCGRR